MEEIIQLTKKELLDYRRKMFKAGKSLEIKADITNQTAEGLVKFIVGEIEIKNYEEKSKILLRFMIWYKKFVPIGTQKTSSELVGEYLAKSSKKANGKE